MLLEHFAYNFFVLTHLPSVLEQLSGLLVEFDIFHKVYAYLTTSDSNIDEHRV